MCVCVWCVGVECVCVHVCVRQRERVCGLGLYVCVCVYVRERERGCGLGLYVCVCV